MNERINGNTCAYHCPPALRDRGRVSSARAGGDGERNF